MIALLLAALGLSAGVLGALMGVGGGIIVVPVLSAGFGLPFREAVAVSLVVIIASSSASAATYVDRRLSDMRVGVVLELATVTGALLGSAVAGVAPTAALKILFACVAAYSAAMMWRRGRAAPEPDVTRYTVRRWGTGLAASGIAGAVSGLIGLGGGFLKVPVMTLAMGIPFKVAAATSNFMIGVTAAASAYVYHARGDLDVMVAAPVLVGVFLGARLGSALMTRIASHRLQAGFAALQLLIAGRMVWDVLRGLR